MAAREPRSPFATLAALLMFATVAVGTGAILTLVVSLGPPIQQTWSQSGTALPLASRLALFLATLVTLNYLPCMGVTVALHLALLLFDLWAGRTPARLPWGVVVTAFLVSTQLLVLLWLGIAFNLPLIR